MRTSFIYLLILCFACFAFGQSQEPQLKKLLERNIPCTFEGASIRLDTAHYAQNRNVSYSYSYYYPKYFKEIWPKEEVVSEVRKVSNAYIDTLTYSSPDKQASFKLFAGQVVPFPLAKRRGVKAGDILAVEKAIDDYIKVIKAGKDKELGKVKIISLCKGVKGYNFSIGVKAYKGDQQYLYKIIVAELPATGELIFSHFLYQYPLEAKEKYAALGITLANEFKADE
jgi:bifunctional DNA-binding transcriptional regulator/antitoxin component of YhaV-PrlF toxin-antitoxin module